MKKILLLMLFCAISVCAKAQEADSLQAKTNISIEELATKLDKLQHDYDYLYCENTLTKEIVEIQSFSNKINISANTLLIMCYHGGFDADLYYSYKLNYDASIEWQDSQISKIEAMRVNIASKILTCTFSDIELDVLEKANEAITSALSVLKYSLHQYKTILDMYKSLK
ncbi:MAG: hypothetical protein IKU22_01230 [Alistipes sp.]|nr:hypothetical protein [Alistipes sp.]